MLAMSTVHLCVGVKDGIPAAMAVVRWGEVSHTFTRNLNHSHVPCGAGDRFQLLWVTKHADLLKEAAANGEVEPTFRGQVGLRG